LHLDWLWNFWEWYVVMTLFTCCSKVLVWK
jgi:hypothetical protein